MEKIEKFEGKAKSFLQEFKAFALKGNIIDLAIGIVIGTAFNGIVNSLVADVIMPAVAAAFGKPDFSAIVLGPVKIGNFINSVINFLIIALSVFVALKVVMRWVPKKKEEEGQG
jgi:large conductance mechanosensitive channel